MKIVLIETFPLCHSLYEYLLQKEYLKGVCSQASTNSSFWMESAKEHRINTFIIKKENISTSFKDWLRGMSPDLVIVCGFSLKIPEALLKIPANGFLNIHFGKLPENKGPDPVFWSIKAREKESAVTIHQMDKNWDNGRTLLMHPVPLVFGETWGMVNSKMSVMLPSLIDKAITLIENNDSFKFEQVTHTSNYKKRPSANDTSINWETQTADEIESLVNACNPRYGGATTYYEGAPVQILEVSPVDSQVPILGRMPGEIIHATPHEGVFVCCKLGQMIKVNVMSTDAGILTAAKYVHLGVRSGHRFTTELKEEVHVK